jgi:hypothetical protein
LFLLCTDKPRVDRQPIAARGRIDSRPQVLRQPQCHPPRAAVVLGRGCDVGGGIGPWLAFYAGRHRELGIATAQLHVDRAGREIAGDLLGRVGQRLEQRQADRGFQRRGQALGKSFRVLATRGGRHTKLVTYRIHVWLQLHDVMVTSMWCHCKCQFGARRP